MPAVTVGGFDLWVDVVDGVKGRYTAQGWELRRKITVAKITTGTTTGKLLTATAALGLMTPPIIPGSGHPDLSSAILEEILPEAIGTAEVALALTYRQHFATSSGTGGLLEVGASIVQESTNRDSDGNPFRMEYAGTQLIDPIDKKPQGATISVPRAQPTYQIVRQETGSPGSKAEIYVGSANVAGWLVDPSAPQRTWLCTGILGRSRDGGLTYEVTYSFQKKTGGGTWDERLVWIDPKTGRPPVDVQSVGNGPNGYPAILVAQVVPMLNFNTLALYP